MEDKFLNAIAKFKQKINFMDKELFSKSCAKISNEIADNTPVSTGTLLGSWSPSVNSRTKHKYIGGRSAWIKGKKNLEIAHTNQQKAMGNLTERLNSTLATLTPSNTYYFINGSDHAMQAEYDGWANTDAQFMVTRARQNWQGKVNEVAKEVIAKHG